MVDIKLLMPSVTFMLGLPKANPKGTKCKYLDPNPKGSPSFERLHNCSTEFQYCTGACTGTILFMYSILWYGTVPVPYRTRRYVDAPYEYSCTTVLVAVPLCPCHYHVDAFCPVSRYVGRRPGTTDRPGAWAYLGPGTWDTTYMYIYTLCSFGARIVFFCRGPHLTATPFPRPHPPNEQNS
eukprot:COSAG02_NODE_122_length_35306_cov_98.280967_26_plen_181_part_00